MSRIPENFNQNEFAKTSDINSLLSALKGTFLPRAFSGKVVGGSDLGSPEAPWGVLHAAGLSVGGAGAVSVLSLRAFLNYTEGEAEVKSTVRYPQDLPAGYQVFTPLNFAFTENTRGVIITVPYSIKTWNYAGTQVSQQDKLLYKFIHYTESDLLRIKIGHKSTRFFNFFTGNPPAQAAQNSRDKFCQSITIGAVEVLAGRTVLAKIVTTQNGSESIPQSVVPTVANNAFAPEAIVSGFASAGVDVGTIEALDFFEGGFFKNTYLDNDSEFTPVTITEL